MRSTDIPELQVPTGVPTFSQFQVHGAFVRYTPIKKHQDASDSRVKTVKEHRVVEFCWRNHTNGQNELTKVRLVN